MIGAIKGRLISIEDTVGFIETQGGVIYRSYLTPTFITSHKLGSEIFLLTFLQVKEDGLTLFGFEDSQEKRMFTLLLTVPGVGPKTAFSIISHTKPGEIINAVTNNDISYFTSIPGLGRKTGMKIILELSQKIKTEFKLDKINLNEEDKTVIQALIALGYSSSEANSLFGKIPKGLSLEDKIKYALRLSTNKK